MNISDPNVLLWSLKSADEGIEEGSIARFWNISNTPAKPLIRFNKEVKSVWQTSHIETNEKRIHGNKNGLQLDFKPQQINTYRILLK
jgi:alpha-mannosidase